MKKRIAGFIPASKVDYQFMQHVLNELRERLIDDCVDDYTATDRTDIERRVSIKCLVKVLRNKDTIIQGSVERFQVMHRNGMYYIKKDPRVVMASSTGEAFTTKPLFLFAYPILRTRVEYNAVDLAGECDIHYTIKIPKGMTEKDIRTELREYNESRTSDSPYDCSGAEVGYAFTLPQRKNGELRIVDCIRYDY